MDPQHATTKQLISDDYEKLQECAPASEARQLFKFGILHVHRPAQDLPLGADHEQAKLTMHPLPAINQKMNSGDRDKLQACVQTPEARQLLKAHGENTLIKLQRLARNAPPLPYDVKDVY